MWCKTYANKCKNKTLKQNLKFYLYYIYCEIIALKEAFNL